MYRLLAVAQIDGAILPAGTVIERPHDWIGPQRTLLPVHETFKGGRTKPMTQALYVRIG